MSCLPYRRSSISVPICLRFFIARDGRGGLKVPPHPSGRVVHEARLFTRALRDSIAVSLPDLPFLHLPFTGSQLQITSDRSEQPRPHRDDRCQFFVVQQGRTGVRAATTGSTSVSATSVQVSSAGTAQLKSAPLGPAVVQQPEIDSRPCLQRTTEWILAIDQAPAS